MIAIAGVDESERRRGREVKEEMHSRTSKYEVGRSYHTSIQTKQKGENGPICLVLNEARRGVFICKRDDTRQVLYKRGIVLPEADRAVS